MRTNMETEQIEYQIDGQWVDGERPVVRNERTIRNTSGIIPGEYAAVPMVELLDRERCYRELLRRLHPDGLACGCGCREAIAPRASPGAWRHRPCSRWEEPAKLSGATPLAAARYWRRCSRAG